ncbi:MAG: hypothetical protein GX424_05220 [Clostridiales bacterium]|nr:hypothetical protein [Clostridiales bacterium]
MPKKLPAARKKTGISRVAIPPPDDDPTQRLFSQSATEGLRQINAGARIALLIYFENNSSNSFAVQLSLFRKLSSQWRFRVTVNQSAFLIDRERILKQLTLSFENIPPAA